MTGRLCVRHAYLARDAVLLVDESTCDVCEPRTVTCPQCDGAGLLTECANDGTHGCSHTNDREWQCPLCREYGAVTAEAAREYLDELAAEAAAEAELRALRAAARPVTTVRDVAAWGPEPF